MDEFFQWLGPKKGRKIRLAVMDMWKAFRNLSGAKSGTFIPLLHVTRGERAI